MIAVSDCFSVPEFKSKPGVGIEIIRELVADGLFVRTQPKEVYVLTDPILAEYNRKVAE